jgi:hypothetical protein
VPVIAGLAAKEKAFLMEKLLTTPIDETTVAGLPTTP